MDKPKIIRRKYVLTPKNVDVFLHVQNIARYNVSNRKIVVRDYKISSDVPAAKAVEASKIIKILSDNMEGYLIHEKHHWHNHTVCGDVIDTTGTNYFQEIMLYCLDEISAFSATELRTSPDCRGLETNVYSVSYAIASGLDEFVSGAGMDYYLERLAKMVREGIVFDLENGNIDSAALNKLLLEYRTNPQKLFNRRFRKIVYQYFTYDNYCIFKDKIPPELKQPWVRITKEFRRIAQIYCNYLARMIFYMQSHKKYQTLSR